MIPHASSEPNDGASLSAARNEMYKQAAAALGWNWSAAHDGYISENHRARNGDPKWSDYKVASDAEEACFWDGIETEADALHEINRFKDMN
ncbi:hypothetical protein [Mesorhizobium sp. SP-1A]|uniref:hypothetical protein n=1 Tax=Mesorhizobium sp. SP-1A TaxID=3077840 RepID=UPI0028F6DE45|nr:hypothetical protein [Mesorhizobium sp. SP-1A]